MRPLQDEVHAAIHGLETRTTELFVQIAKESSLGNTKSKSNPHVWNEVLVLTRAQADLAGLLELAAQHQANQARIDTLIESIKATEAKQRRTILRVNELHSELRALVERGEKGAQEMYCAESRPLSSKDILDYARRLARYTSAPSGYELDAEKSEHGGAQQPSQPAQQHNDFNDHAEHARSYYDPVIPTMPHEMPFPSDRLMRQGILYADAVQSDSSMLEAVQADTPAQMPGKEEAPVENNKDMPVLDSFAMDEDDVFDLDLNP